MDLQNIEPEVTELTQGILRLTFSCFVKKCMWKQTEKKKVYVQ